MRNLVVGCAIVALAIVGVGCGKKAVSVDVKSSASPSAVVATVDGTDITDEELTNEAKGQLQKVETQIYQIKKRVLDGIVEDKLIESAAKKSGKSSNDYIAAEIGSKIADPTDQEVKALYDSRKGNIDKPFEEVKPQIIAYLKQNKMMGARQALIDQLKKDAKVQININPPRTDIDIKGAPAMGDEKAPITLVEFSDYECPFCKRVRQTVWKVIDSYKGKIRYVFMDFPLSFHKESKKAHEAAHCAGDQDKYFDYSRKLFDNQGKLGVADLKKYAKEMQLKTADFDKCLDEGKFSKTVDDFVAKGMAAGVNGTPAYFINGIMISGAQPEEAFKEIIDSELKR